MCNPSPKSKILEVLLAPSTNIDTGSNFYTQVHVTVTCNSNL